jgi:hypothetical protein
MLLGNYNDKAPLIPIIPPNPNISPTAELKFIMESPLVFGTVKEYFLAIKNIIVHL